MKIADDRVGLRCAARCRTAVRVALRRDQGDVVAERRRRAAAAMPRADRDRVVAVEVVERAARRCCRRSAACAARSSGAMPRTSAPAARRWRRRHHLALDQRRRAARRRAPARRRCGERRRYRSSGRRRPIDVHVPVEAEDPAEQLGAEAVHHRHHDDQRRDAERDAEKREAGDDRDEAFLRGARADSGSASSPLEGGRTGAYRRSSRARSSGAERQRVERDSSCALAGGAVLQLDRAGLAAPRGPMISCQGRPIRSIVGELGARRARRGRRRARRRRRARSLA